MRTYPWSGPGQIEYGRNQINNFTKKRIRLMMKIIKGFQQFLNENSEMGRGLYTYEVGVAVWEIGERECSKLVDEFEKAGIEILDRTAGLYNGDEDWTLRGTKRNLERTLLAWGFDFDEDRLVNDNESDEEISEMGRGRHTYSSKEVSFSQWLEDLLAQWPFIRKDFEEAGIDPYSLTDDNFYGMVKSAGFLYNKDRNLYRMGKYISVERNENWKGEFVTRMQASADISTYGRWSSNGEGTVVGNPHPDIDTGREGT